MVNLALDSYKKAGLTPRVQTFRGGTDGNFITKKGIPTPNLFNGGGNYHGRYEYVTVEQMDKRVSRSDIQRRKISRLLPEEC